MPTPPRTRRPRAVRAVITALFISVSSASAALAQSAPLGLGAADRLVWAGAVPQAESLLYAASSRAPRDAAARAALGRWLAARGAVRPGTVLLEEARFFGGDAGAIARDLAPLYERLADWRALVGLPATPLTAGERRRADAMLAQPMQVSAPESTTVALVAADSGPIGAVLLKVGESQVTARVDPRVRGLVLDTAWRSRSGVEAFDEAQGPAVAGIARRVGLGGLAWTRLPVRFAPLGGALEARIGLDVLAPFRPTFHAARGTVVLRRPVPARQARSIGIAWPLVSTAVGWGIVPPRDSLRLLAGSRSRQALGGRAWTLEAARGVVTVVFENEKAGRE